MSRARTILTAEIAHAVNYRWRARFVAAWQPPALAALPARRNLKANFQGLGSAVAQRIGNDCATRDDFRRQSDKSKYFQGISPKS
jgi:hypothetical protein